MARYLALWEADNSRIPIDPKERGSGWGVLMDKVKQDIKKGVMKDFGGFVGMPNGFCILEGTELEIDSSIQQYMPFFTYRVYPLTSVEQVDKMIKALSK